MQSPQEQTWWAAFDLARCNGLKNPDAMAYAGYKAFPTDYESQPIDYGTPFGEQELAW